MQYVFVTTNKPWVSNNFHNTNRIIITGNRNGWQCQSHTTYLPQYPKYSAKYLKDALNLLKVIEQSLGTGH